MASSRPSEYSTEIGVEICTRLASGKPLTVVCRQKGMPALSTVYKWRSVHAEFDRLLLRARCDQADTLFAEAIEIADERCVDGVAVQRNRLRVDTRKWAAGKMNPRLYGEQLAIGGAEELPPLRVDPVQGAKAIAFVLARAGALLGRVEQPVAAPAPPQRTALEHVPAYRPVMRSVESAERRDFDAEEDDAALARIGDPLRVESQPEGGRQPLSAARNPR